MSKILLLVFCLWFSVFTARGGEAWQEHANERFGFRWHCPAALLASPEPANGDGRELHTADRAFSVAVCGGLLMTVDGDSLESRWQEEMRSEGRKITYKKKAATWYVVSGLTQDSTEFYNKFYIRAGNWAAFYITYPHAQNRKYDAWVTRIEKSFVPFPVGDFDRVQR